MYNTCYQVAVVNTVATTDISQLPACSTYTTMATPIGKKRRKRSNLMNDEVRGTTHPISPSKVSTLCYECLNGHMTCHNQINHATYMLYTPLLARTTCLTVSHMHHE